MWQYIVDRRDRQWRERVEQIDDEILDCAAATYDIAAIDELRKAAQDKGKWAEAPPHPDPLPEGEGTNEIEKRTLIKLRSGTGQGMDAEALSCNASRKTIS